jgi:hypothetical protein
MTGTLPTFIDMRNNFGSSAITEDSLVHVRPPHHAPPKLMGMRTHTHTLPICMHVCTKATVRD